jgi:hypothetical protein
MIVLTGEIERIRNERQHEKDEAFEKLKRNSKECDRCGQSIKRIQRRQLR